VTPEQHIWACALAVEKQHGSQAAIFIAERIGALALQGDAPGVQMWKAIAARLDALSRSNPGEASWEVWPRATSGSRDYCNL